MRASTRQLLSIIIGLMMSSSWAFSQECNRETIDREFPTPEICIKNDVCDDGQLYYLDRFDSRSKRKWNVLTTEHSMNLSNTMRFYKYIIKRNNHTNDGVIQIKSIRQVDAIPILKQSSAKNVALYRNAFPTKDGFDKDISVPFTKYENYHLNGVAIPDELSLFHLEYHDLFTNKPASRRESFAYNASSLDDYTLRKTMLIYYKGIQPRGTEITFCVGESSNFKTISLLIADITGTDYIPMVWTIRNSR